MNDMDDKKVIRLCLIGSALSIIALYFISLQITSDVVKVGDITEQLAGKTVNVTGQVSSLYLHKNGHVFFNLIDGEDKVRVVIWESMVEQLKYSGMNVSEINNGDKVQVVGTVEMYQGEPEIIPVKAQVRIL
jgi:exonuclease VII large subunit